MNTSGDINKFMQLKEQIEKMQKQLHTISAEGSVGGGMVKVSVNGHLTILSVQIEEKLLYPDKKNITEEMVVSAVNLAIQNVKEEVRKEFGSLTPGPAGFMGM